MLHLTWLSSPPPIFFFFSLPAAGLTCSRPPVSLKLRNLQQEAFMIRQSPIIKPIRGQFAHCRPFCGVGLAGDRNYIFWFNCSQKENACFGGNSTKRESRGKNHMLFGGRQHYTTKCKISAMIWIFFSPLMDFSPQGACGGVLPWFFSGSPCWEGDLTPCLLLGEAPACVNVILHLVSASCEEGRG